MKISLALIFLAVFQVSASNSFAQTKVSLNAENITLEQFFTELEQQTGDIFVFSNADVDVTQKINVASNEEIVTELLDRILKGLDLGYSINNGYISVYKQQQVQQTPRTRIVKGFVGDENGSPLVGVTVVVKGTTKGIATDAAGMFALEVEPRNTALEFSYIGYKKAEVSIVNQSELIVTLRPETVAIDDVVVTGYQTIERGRATGSFETVKPEEFNMVVSNDIVDKLEGIVPGLAVNSDGEMMIRGQATIYAQTNPLVVVDGFPMEYGTYNINPNDIESISVLKDAASASIWGVRAANGVIVITTKKGAKNQKTTVSYTGSVKIGSKFDLSSLGYLNTEQQIDWEREKFANYPTSISNISVDYPSYFSEAAWIEYQYQNGLNGVDGTKRERLFGELGSYNNYKDIEKHFYRNSLLQTHNIVVSGGSETITNYLSVNFENSMADLIGNKRNSAGIQLNSTFDLNKRIKLTTGFRGNYASRDTYSGDPTQMLPYVRIKDSEGNYVNEYYGVSQLMKDDLESKGYGDWSYNRLNDRSLTDNNTKSYNVAANVQLDVDIIKGLRFTTSGMFIVDHSSQEVLNDKNSYYVRDLFNRFTAYDNGVLTNHLPEGAVKNMYDSNSTSYTFRNTLNYNYSSGDFSMSLMGGCELFAIRAKTESDTYYGYDPQGMNYDSSMNLYDLVNTGVTGYSAVAGLQRLSYAPGHTDAEDRYFSTFFTGSFSYTDRYTLFGSIRYDKTNLYGRSGKYRDQPTWSVGGKWNISQENFFNVSKIDVLALKLSYGLSGNIDKTTSPYLIASNGRDALLGLPVLTIDNPANADLAWEKVYSFNAGLEYAMFGNRLNLSADYYVRNTRDALGYIVTDPTTGWDNVKKNTASLTNRGFDLSITGRPVMNDNWRWTSTLTFSYNYNEVTKVNSGEESAAMITSGNPLLGKPVDYVYAYRNGGLSNTGQLQVLDATGNVYLFNETGGFTPDDLLIMGRYSPKYFGAWSNVVSWKGFEFDMLITYKLGHKVRMPSISNADSDRRPYKTFDRRWREPGDEDNTWIPTVNYAVSSQYNNTMNNNEKMIEDGDLIRLKSVGLSYDFKRLIKTNVLSALTLKFSVENPWFWAANGDGLDPDRLVNGWNSVYMGDQPTYYTFTLNVKF